jgi:hypothetical protein
MKSEKLYNDTMVNGKYNAVIPCLTRYPLKEEIPAFAGMTSKKRIPLLWRGVRRRGWLLLRDE